MSSSGSSEESRHPSESQSFRVVETHPNAPVGQSSETSSIPSLSLS